MKRACFFLVLVPALPGALYAGAAITLDSSTRHTTMTGWEVVCWAGETNTAAFPNYIDEVLDKLVNEAGVNRIRLEVRSGVENDQDYWTQYRQGLIDYPTWRSVRYANVNDNADPDSINSSGFHFSEMDNTIDNIVLPLKQLVEANGEHLFINLNYVAFTAQITTGQYIHDDPDEYAEFVLATYQHLQNKYGWVPDTWEVLLEPDNVTQWNGTTLGNAILAVRTRLEAESFTARFVAPSNTNMGNAVSYFDAMAAVLGPTLVHKYVTEICYHRYGGVSDANLQAIANRGVQYDIGTSMLEWWSDSNTYAVLHKDLDMGRNCAWERGGIAGIGTAPDNGTSLYIVDDTDPDNPVVMINHGTKFARQYFKFVRIGAVRIGAASNDGNFEPLAWVNTDNKWVVVVKAAAGGSFGVQGLPAGTYGIMYSTSNAQWGIDPGDQTITAGQTLNTSIPAAGVLTIYAKSVGEDIMSPIVSVESIALSGTVSDNASCPVTVSVDGTAVDVNVSGNSGTWTSHDVPLVGAATNAPLSAQDASGNSVSVNMSIAK